MRKWRVYIDMIERQKPVSGESWDLVPLTPEYIEAEHGEYVAAIEAALEDGQIRNVALSGNYGVGKSSILREVARRNDRRVVELSLSTLAPIEVSKLDESVPIQATTPTNRIQQEIVKQLLYRADPSKTPCSRFRRIERFRWQREIGTATLLGLAIVVTFLLTGWTSKIAAAFTTLKDLGVWINMLVWIVGTITTLLFRWLFYGKLHIKQLSAGSATVTLNDNSVSYFDQYLDEIVYFFDVSDRNIVIFEDIDRFNDSHIFETLRALNTLLNASPHIKKPIRFIYAIKDSIFDRIGLEAEGRKIEAGVFATDDPAQAESIRANRTKFFDLIIPVVPFITHRSARNLAVKLLGEIEHKVSPELLDLAAQFVPDMRLLKNVRNEFIVFRNRIFSGDGGQLNLSETELFAMMLYKSTHLTDFETIRIGMSKLDILYQASRELVTENIKRIEGERRMLLQRLSRIDGVATRSEKLGEQLIAYVQRVLEAARFQRQNATFSFNQVVYSTDELKGAQFWKDFISSGGDAVLNCRDNYGHSLSFSLDNLAAALGHPLDADSWNQIDHEALTEQFNERGHDIKFLRSADLGDLVKRPEFLVQHGDIKQSLEVIAKTHLKPGLAYQLLRAGYINRNFTLYTSTFHGDRVSPAATNFIIHHVERDLMDEHYQLSPEDVDAVVRERGKHVLREPALYNIAILDRLLTTDIDAADIMIGSLVSFEDSQTRFLQAYLAAGDQRPRFIEQFTVAYSKVLPYLVSSTVLDDASRLQFVNIALAYLPSLKQRTDSVVSRYLSSHYAELTVLTSEATKPAQAERISMIFADANIIVPSLKLLSLKVRPSFVLRNLYEVTYENLTIAIGNAKTVALDVIRTTDEIVYNYVLNNLRTYLNSINGLSKTIETNNHFLTVIEDVLKQKEAHLGDVIEYAAPECEVNDLADVSEGAWSVLAEHQRFPSTFDNISRYVSAFGGVDARLAKVLVDSGEITNVDTTEDEPKIKLAVIILAAKDELPSASLRVELVVSLNLNNYLCIDNIAAEEGDLFALLLKHNIIADDAKSYEHLNETDWPTRRAFICESKEFVKYMTPELVQLDLAVLLTSDVIDLEIKNLIVEQATVYVEVAGPQGLNELAQFATLHGCKLTPDVVQKMAQGGVPAQQIVLLLEPHLTLISRDQLITILQALDFDYPKLAVVGYDKPYIPNTPADRALLERLKREGIVGKYDELESPIKVNKKYK